MCWTVVWILLAVLRYLSFEYFKLNNPLERQVLCVTFGNAGSSSKSCQCFVLGGGGTAVNPKPGGAQRSPSMLVIGHACSYYHR